jgi:hypothetical protein
MPRPDTRLLDSLGIAASLACLAHCLLVPLLIALLPTVSAMLAMPESVHAIAFAFAVPASALAMVGGYRRHGALQPVFIGSLGLAALGIGALAGLDHLAEVGSTIVGSLLLAAAHVQNWRLRTDGVQDS